MTGPRRVLPLVTALAFAGGAVNAHRLPARTVWGDVYGHVPNHLVTAGIALLLATSLLALARAGAPGRGRRATARAGGAWALVSAVFVLDAVGGGIGDRTGAYALHDAAMLLLPVAGLLLLVASALLVLARSNEPPWQVRLAAVAGAPGALALNQASSTGWLAAGLVAAAAWLAVAVTTAHAPAAPDVAAAPAVA